MSKKVISAVIVASVILCSVSVVVGSGVGVATAGMLDLVASNIDVPGFASVQEEINISWTIENQGSSDIISEESGWPDCFYLSEDDQLDDSDSSLWCYWHYENLSVGESRTITTERTIPSDVSSGSYYLLVKADAWDYFEESNENNNILSKEITIGVPDLVVTAIDAPNETDTLWINVSWTVQNQGDGVTSMKGGDILYLSTDDQLDRSDTLLPMKGSGVEGYWDKSYYSGDILAPNETYTATVEAGLPRVALGDYYLIVKANALRPWWGYPAESNYENNVLAKPITIEELELVVKTSGNAPMIKWSKTFGTEKSETGRFVQQIADGGYIVVGDTQQAISLIKTNLDGKKEWEKTFEEESYSYSCGAGESLQQTVDGGYIIAGSRNKEDSEALLIKTDSEGDKQWERLFTGKMLNSVQQTKDSGYVATGYIGTSGSGGLGDIWLIKSDEKGDVEWQNTFTHRGEGYWNGDVGNSVQQTADGGCIVVGTTCYYYYEPWSYIWLIKTDENGNEEWNKTFSGGYLNNHGYSIQKTSEGGYILLGATYMSYGGTQTAYVIKLDKDGNKEWERTFEQEGQTYSLSIQQTIDNGYVMAGSILSAGQQNDLWIKKLYASGNDQWEIIMGSKDLHDSGRAVQQTADDGYIVIGETKSYGAGERDIWLVKLKGEKHVFRVSEKLSSQSDLTETILSQNATATNVTVTGDLNGIINFSLEIPRFDSGYFKGKGFFKGQWEATLEEALYKGEWEGILYFDEETRRIHLKGATLGEITGTIEGIISESEPESGSYDQYKATWKLNRVGVQELYAVLNLNVKINFSEPTSYFSTKIYTLQASFEGKTKTPDCHTIPSDATITHLRVADENNPYNGEGFSIISYISETGSGEIWTYNKVTIPGKVELTGLSTGPFEGIVSGTLDESKSLRTLFIAIERINLALPPGPDLEVITFGPNRISPGQRVNYIIEYRNDGAKSAENIVVVTQLPSLAEYVSCSEGGIYWQEKHQVFWTLETLMPKEKGILWVKVNYKWGIAEDAIHHTVSLIGSQTPENEPSPLPLNVEEYFYRQRLEVISTKTLSPEEVKLELSNNENFKELYDYAVELCFIPTNISLKSTLYDNSTILRLMMINNNSNGFLFVTKANDISFLEKHKENTVTFFDRGGGLTYNETEDTYTAFGEWNESGSCTKGQCVRNCFFIKLIPKPPILGRSIACADCFINPEKNWDSCLSCAVPKSGAPAGVVKCIKDCKKDANSHCCKVGEEFSKCESCLICRIECKNKYKCIWPGIWDLRSSICCACKGFPGDPWSEASLVKQCIYCEDCINGECYCDECLPGMQKSGTSVAHDPNVKYGPKGNVSAGQKLDYKVEYENEGEGIAFGVYFTDTLDEDLDDSTLEIEPVTDVKTGTKIAEPGTYDPKTRTITWFVGEVGPDEGGYANFSVNVRSDAPDGSEIINFATVYFPSVPEITKTNGVVSIIRSPGCYIGAYLGCSSEDVSCESIKEFNRKMDKNHTIFVRYVDIADSRNQSHWEWAEEVKRNGAMPMFIYDPWDGLNNINISDVEYFTSKCKKFNETAFIVFGHEMNGVWYPWGNDPGNYTNKFKEVAEIFHRDAPNVKMCWVPNQNWDYPWGGTDYGDGYSEYYPEGSGYYGEYVDWVGLRFYDKDWDENNEVTPDFFVSNIKNGQNNTDFYEMFVVGKNKPLLIAETGAFDPNKDPTASEERIPLNETEQAEFKNEWIKQVYNVSTLKAEFQRLNAICYFHVNKTEPVIETRNHSFCNTMVDYRIPEDPNVYKNLIADPYFIGVEKQAPAIFDTGAPANPYPSIFGTHNGTITPNQTIRVSKLHTYPCTGTGGHTEYARIWNSLLDVNATWNGYVGDWHNISFNKSFTLIASETYNYTIRTGSYPQIHHTSALPTANGWINCTEFVDANGKTYNDWIPAIKLWS